ncbi:hypothetical protein [Streptomyces gardneri]|uniref:hypothetical protein n=1 Tax=Streptomyces gardneri TaxID=66892 RepID=UPI0035D553ED
MNDQPSRDEVLARAEVRLVTDGDLGGGITDAADVIAMVARLQRFGEHSTHELGIQPEAYDPKLDVDFAPLRDQDLTTVGLDQAA